MTPEIEVLAMLDKIGVKLPLWRLIINREICWCRYAP
jgi:hypothetical protein